MFLNALKLLIEILRIGNHKSVIFLLKELERQNWNKIKLTWNKMFL